MNKTMKAKYHVSLKVTVLTLFLGVIGVILSVVVFFQYYYGKSLALDSSEIIFSKVSQVVSERISGIDRRTSDALRVIEKHPLLGKKQIPGDLNPIIYSFESVLEQNSFISSIYVSYDNGDTYGMLNLDVSNDVKELLKPPNGAKWMIFTTNTRSGDGKKIRLLEFFDKNLVDLDSRVEYTDEDKRTKGWYKLALNSPSIIKSEPDLFEWIGKRGVTYARYIKSNSVVIGADIVQDTLDEILESQKITANSKLLIVKQSGSVIAGYKQKDSTQLKVTELRDYHGKDIFELISSGKSGFQTRSMGGSEDLIFIKKLDSEIKDGEHLVIISPIEDIIAPFREVGYKTVLFLIFSVLIFVPIVILVANTMALPIKNLVKESNKIKSLEFRDIIETDSFVSEISELSEGILDAARAMSVYQENLASEEAKLEKIITSGIALSSERDKDKLFEMILLSAKELTNADGGTLYVKDGNELSFEIIMNDTLGVKMGGTTHSKPTFPTVKLINPETGEPNMKNVASVSAIKAETIVIEDAYHSSEYDFSGTKIFDERNKYRSKSFLTVPLKPRDGEVIGVVQLINAQDPKTGEVIAFHKEIVSFVEALASQAAIALDNQHLLQAQIKLLDSLVRLIAGAIDAKSSYTGGHCERVPVLAEMLAQQASDSDEGIFRDFRLTTDDEWRELKIGAWLHDCGKVTTPEYVVDKATKLETIYNRIHEVRTRFEVIWRDAEIDFWQKLYGGGDEEALREELNSKKQKIKNDFKFIANANVGGEFMKKEDIERVKEIAKTAWTRHLDNNLGISQVELERMMGEPPYLDLPMEEELLSDRAWHVVPRTPQDGVKYDGYGFKMNIPENLYNFGEVYNLCIERGTLTNEERFKINEHVIQTIMMLEKLPLPKGLEKVPEIAGTHHETLIGTGYPRKLTKNELSIPARIMAIADIFEALTASDRPYKKAKTLSEAIKILSFMKKDQHVDPDVFELFLTSGVYLDYANRFLQKEQIDEVDISQYISKPQTS